MNNPRFSVVIPTYNGADTLREAIQSVLGQTCSNFEIIVVDDASPEGLAQDAVPCSDARLRYVRHPYNKGAVAARKTGVHASTGDIIAFLDQDDLFHGQKLESHLDYLEAHPGVGATYNARFEIQGADRRLCGIHRPPATLSLDDWVLGFPLSPSDVVLTREWALKDELWDDSFAGRAEHVIFNGQEIVFGGRLSLAGCRLGCVDRALNYRRHHPHRRLKHLRERCEAELACQDVIFSDPRCPQAVRELKGVASANIYVMWAYTAYIQGDFALGQRFLEQAMSLRPAFFGRAGASPFLDTWLAWISAGTVDVARDHVEIVKSVLGHLPIGLEPVALRRDWAIARSHLLRGLHTMLWGREDDAELSLAAAFQQGASVDEAALSMLSDQLWNYGAELGPAAAQRIVDRLSDLLVRLGRDVESRRLVAHCAVTRAFRCYHAGGFDTVPGDVVQAVRNNPMYLLNRGVLSIFVRSLYQRRVRTGAWAP